ncbi:M1 family metallopeptidase [Aquimarina intermedia]|uniref:Aminopeptidase N n=1 Tax=Aquimarina intermedia TaxID=350814 RepID=A0A5S5BTL8_9FLAO|nr:M1 family metallopeptidase [Aquimarina intermedia]TYP70369.1 aminopeptidase N [Aquimarina intermedia]
MKFIVSYICMAFSLTVAAQSVDFLTADANILIDAEEKSVAGTVEYTFKTLEAAQTIRIDARAMQLEALSLDGKKISYTYDNAVISLSTNLKPNTTHTIVINYTAIPKKAVYFVKDYQGRNQIWTQGQGKYTSHWLPSFDDMQEKVIFDLTLNYNKEAEVLANGKLIEKKLVNDSIQSWKYDMKKPMSSYLVAFAIGSYNKIEKTTQSGIPLTLYYYPEDSAKVEPTYRHSKRMFNFLEKEIGIPYPWQNYKQIPVKDFLYAGMENTGTTIFSDAFVVDSIAYQDRNYISVNAHELAHQWFGNLVTATEGTHHWLQEGFATYYALLAEREIFGDDYFEFKLYESAEQLIALSKKDQATALLDPKASSLTFYQRGAWSLHALRNLIGEDHFKTTIREYLKEYQFKNVTTANFLKVAERVSKMKLDVFKNKWLENVRFPAREALEILTQSNFIKAYLSLAQERTQPLAGKWGRLAEVLEFPINEYLAQEATYQLEGQTSQEALAMYNKAFETNNLLVRQAIATTLSKITPDLQKQYETLLTDESYATIEAALYYLWSNYPEKRSVYLQQTKDIIGFNDKNVRILWLVLALNTPNYNPSNHANYYQELSGYTSSKHHFSTRENAFMYLESLQFFSDEALLNLVDGAVHYNWRFRNQCREILDKLLQNPKYQKKYVVLRNNLSEDQKDYLAKKLTP